MSDQISREDFRQEFLKRVYPQEVSTAQRALEPILVTYFNNSIHDIVSSEGKVLRVKYRRYSTVHNARVNLIRTPVYMITVVLDINSRMIAQFSCSNSPTLESFKRKLAQKVTIEKINLTLVEDQDENLQEILDVTREAHELLIKERAKLSKMMFDDFQERFEKHTGYYLSEIADVYFNYSQSIFFDYLTKSGFTGIPEMNLLPEASSKTSTQFPSAYPLTGWTLTRKPDGYGHECGSAVDVDWFNKKLSTQGWSSDD